MNLNSLALEMIKQAARSVMLASDKRAIIQLPSGNRATRDPISHEQLTRMLMEAAPWEYQAQLRAGVAPPPFTLVGGGTTFVVEVEGDRDAWSVTLRQKGEEVLDESEQVVSMPELSSPPPLYDASTRARSSLLREPPPTPSAPLPPPAIPKAPVMSGNSGFDLEVEYESPPVGVVVPMTPASPKSPPNAARAVEHSVTLSPSVSTQGPSALSSRTGVGQGGSSGGGAGFGGTQSSGSPLGAAPSGSTPLVTPSITSSPGQSALSPLSPSGPTGGAGPRAEASPTPSKEAVAVPPASVPAGGVDESDIYQFDPEPYARVHGEEPDINRLLRKLVESKGSDLHLTSGLIPRFRVSGKMLPVADEAPTSEEEMRRLVLQIMPRRLWKDFLETRDVDYAHSISGVARFRVNVGSDRHGTFLVTRVIPNRILTPEQIGLPKKVLDLCFLTKGIVLVTGPTGSGKSTTLATLIDVINSNREDHIITIEDPIEFVHPDNKKCLVRQREVGEHTGSFKRALKAALREDPDIVLVGEMRDLETIAIAIETASTGHLVFGTLHTSTAPSTVDRIIDQFPAHQQDQIRVMLADSLKGVIAQTLCKKIGGGMVAAFEILIATRAVANLIREGKTFQIYSSMQTAKNTGTVTLTENLVHLVKQKIISPEEAYVKAVIKDELMDRLTKLGIRVNLASLMEE